MKRKVLLILDADADTAGVVALAASSSNYDLRFVQTSKDFFHFCNDNFENVAGIILDVDPGVHGMTILEALDTCENTPPIIVVSALEEQWLSAVVQRHGAVACLGKPLSAASLAQAIEENLESVVRAPRCDLWGHVVSRKCICRRSVPSRHFVNYKPT